MEIEELEGAVAMRSRNRAFCALSRKAFAFPDMVVSIAVVSLLLSSVMPLVLQLIVSARKARCEQNLMRTGQAVWGYYDLGKRFPCQGRIESRISVFRLTPSDGDYRCPADQRSNTNAYVMNYCWNAGRGLLSQPDGYIVDDSPDLQMADFADGLGSTAMASESRIFGADSAEQRRQMWRIDSNYPRGTETALREGDRGRLLSECEQVNHDDDHIAINGDRGTVQDKMEIYSHALTPNRVSCESSNATMTVFLLVLTANSEHFGGVHLLLVDGSVKFVSDAVDPKVWEALATRAGSKMVSW